MTTKVVPGLLIATPDVEGVAREASARMGKAIRDAITARGNACIALSGGESPRAAYTLLAADEKIEWSKVSVFWVDERATPPTDDRNNYRWAKTSLLDPAKISARNVHRMPADAPDLDAAARAYETLIRKMVSIDAQGIPAFDLMVLGIGEDGHTASLFPGERTIDITDRLVTAVPAAGKREARMTLTVPLIEHARLALVIAVGKNKLGPLERVWQVNGDAHATPARVIRGVRGSIMWIIDKAAGGLG
jgi:6-phosphogluconolactonase